MQYPIRFIDTRIDTKKIFVPMTITIKLRNYVNKEKLSPLYLHVSSGNRRERIFLDIFVDPKYWNAEKSILVGPSEKVSDSNLIIENVKSKITGIKTYHRLSNKVLTIDAFVHEFNNEMPRGNFIKYFKAFLDDRKASIKKSTYDKELYIYEKLKVFAPELLFHNIDEMFFERYRNHLSRLGNGKTTQNGNIKIIKKYLRYALKSGAVLPISIDDIKAGSTKGSKNYLNAKEVYKCYKYYKSEFIPKNHKIAMGYFLFSCFTGLRFSDVMRQTRSSLADGHFTFKHVKTGRSQVVKLNLKAKEIIDHCPDLFVTKYSNSHVRTLVKEICAFMRINKPIDYHMSRHTFGTNYIMLGGSVTTLQNLMNHSDIRETMTYVHLAELEKNAEADILDDLFEERLSFNFSLDNLPGSILS